VLLLLLLLFIAIAIIATAVAIAVVSLFPFANPHCPLLHNLPLPSSFPTGTKVTFPAEGDEAPGTTPPDVVFVIQEKPDEATEAAYKREGNNLVYTHKISLSDALTDCSLQIPTLDNRTISVACPEVVSPFYEKTVGGEGMPLSKKAGQKGDLVVRFHILFPKYLNGNKRTKIKELLSGEELLN